MNKDGLTVTAPTLMWIKVPLYKSHIYLSADAYFIVYLQALDLLLERMKAESFPFECVVSLSGCGQQHGSVYWRRGSEGALRGLRKEETLCTQLQVRMQSMIRY